VPWLAVAETNDSPAGKASCTATFVAGLAARLVSVTVNMIVSPTFGVAFETDFERPRSAAAWTPADAELLDVSGSNWSE